MITSTVCIVVVLVAAAFFLKVCRVELQELMEFFTNIVSLALQELRFSGGRAAKANMILCVCLAILFIFLAFHGMLREVRELLGGDFGQDSTRYLYLLFGLLLLFFFVSLCFVFSQEKFLKRMGRRG